MKDYPPDKLAVFVAPALAVAGVCFEKLQERAGCRYPGCRRWALMWVGSGKGAGGVEEKRKLGWPLCRSHAFMFYSDRYVAEYGHRRLSQDRRNPLPPWKALQEKRVSIEDLDKLPRPDPDDQVWLSNDPLIQERLALFLTCLSPREADILVRHNGLFGHKIEFYREIGRSWRLSLERIRQIEGKAICKLQNRVKRERRLRDLLSSGNSNYSGPC